MRRFFIQKKKQKTQQKAGFSLIELLVAVTLFVIVMTVSVGTLLALVDANRKAQSLKSVINNLNFALETISRTIRTGDTYYCTTAQSIESVNLPSGTLSCATGNTAIVLNNDANPTQRVAYRFINGRIERRIAMTGMGWIALTAPEVAITDARFYVTGAEGGDGEQPLVTLAIHGETGFSVRTDSSFQVQTTVAQRDLDD